MVTVLMWSIWFFFSQQHYSGLELVLVASCCLWYECACYTNCFRHTRLLFCTNISRSSVATCLRCGWICGGQSLYSRVSREWILKISSYLVMLLSYQMWRLTLFRLTLCSCIECHQNSFFGPRADRPNSYKQL